MNALARVVAAYVPGLHASYLRFFERYATRVSSLFLLDQSLLTDFPEEAREIRALTAGEARQAICGLGYFPHVILADAAALARLNRPDTQVILPDERLSRVVAKRHLPLADCRFDADFFLRYDAQYVQAAVGEAAYDTAVTAEAFHQCFMQGADTESRFSSDWFRQVGALLVHEGTVLAASGNERSPSPHDCWLVGDPRNFLPYGSDPERTTVLHAERGVIALAARRGIATEGASLYVTTYPCPGCVPVVIAAGIRTVYFRDGYADLRAPESFRAHGVEVVRVLCPHTDSPPTNR
jgi:dCMP deaminase